jgi:hypothetical protein
MLHRSLLVVSLVMVVLLIVECPRSGQSASKSPADCTWQFAGSYRKPVKLRTGAQATNYTDLNNGQLVTVAQFLQTVCGFDPQVPQQIPNAAMPGLETVRVKLHGFLLGAKFERTGDHDIHVEIGDQVQWHTPHLVVEVPPGPAYCLARTHLCDLIKADVGNTAFLTNDRWILNNPPEVTVTGYIFLDGIHAGNSRDFCHKSGGRGLRAHGLGSQVKGCWEVHPVTAVAAGP